MKKEIAEREKDTKAESRDAKEVKAKQDDFYRLNLQEFELKKGSSTI